MWAMPLLAAATGTLLALLLLRRYLAAAEPDLLAWAGALLLLAGAAACALAGSLNGWSEFTAKAYYLGAAVLFTACASLGSAYYNSPRVIGHIWLVVVGLAAAVAGVLAATARVDLEELSAGGPGWSAIETGDALVGLVVALSSLGTLIIVAAAVYAFVYRRAALGQGLLAAGVMSVALAGSLARLDDWEWAFLGWLPGLVMVYAGATLADRAPRARFSSLP